MKKLALVSGSEGFVGRHIVARLLADGYSVTGVDNDLRLHDPRQRGPRRVGYMLCQQDARVYLRDNPRLRVDLVVHCAAVVGGRTMIEGSPLQLAVEDLTLDAELFRWALRARPEQIVYFSSSAAYPTRLQTRGWLDYVGPGGMGLREDDIDLDDVRSPDQSYGWVKMTGEMLAGHANALGIPTFVFRPFSGYGSDQHTDYPFASFIDRALRRDDPFDVWGDGDQARDFVHIDDVVDTVMAALAAGVSSIVPGPVNIGTGRATTFNQLAALVCEAAGYEPEIRHLPAQPVGVHWRVADTTGQLAVHTPTVTLEEGIRRALADRA